jgi:hypothetical protein
MSPHQIFHHQCAAPGIDPIGKPPSVNPVYRTHAKDSHPKPASDHELTSSRTRLSSPLVTAREQQPWCAPTRMWLTLSENPGKNHQESDSSKQARASIPPPNTTRSCVSVMNQDYPLTGPSPGANQHTYPSSLPPARGNLLSNISPKSHGSFLFIINNTYWCKCFSQDLIWLNYRPFPHIFVFFC